jgi:hypothetical protein
MCQKKQERNSWLSPDAHDGAEEVLFFSKGTKKAVHVL